jgi:hypothetical protein
MYMNVWLILIDTYAHWNVVYELHSFCILFHWKFILFNIEISVGIELTTICITFLSTLPAMCDDIARYNFNSFQLIL